MTFEEIKNTIEEQINDSSVETVMDYLNVIYNETGAMFEEIIYENDEDFFNRFYYDDMLGAIRAIKYGNFNFNDDYIVINGYLNLDTYSYVEIKDYIECIAPEMAAIFAEDFLENDGYLFEGIPLYEDLQKD